MKSAKLNSNLSSRMFVAFSVMLGAVTVSETSLAAGLGGLSLDFGSTVHRIVGTQNIAGASAGVSDPVSLRAADNINTRGFALRRDGAY